jgi:hypothetical protein
MSEGADPDSGTTPRLITRLEQGSSRLPVEIACFDTVNMPATLISTTGYHCDVWRIIRRRAVGPQSAVIDFVVKRHLQPCTLREIEIMQRDYELLSGALGDMVPKAWFVATRVSGALNCVVIAEPVTPWFNLANPAYEEEGIELLRRHRKAQDQLRRFLAAARTWDELGDGRVIDLWGLDNLVLDVDRRVRYIDSFRVFFHTDMLHILDEADEDLEERIRVSRERRAFLQHILSLSERR